MAAMYAVYHGPEGLKNIALKVHFLTQVLAEEVHKLGYTVLNKDSFFDTLLIETPDVAETLHQIATERGMNLRKVDNKRVGVTLDESVSPDDLVNLINTFASAVSKQHVTLPYILGTHHASPSSFDSYAFPSQFTRASVYLEHPVFNAHHSETEMLRYIHHLQSKDLSLVHGMIPLGSCTMKLNSTASMIPLTFPGFGGVHPFAPVEQVPGYQTLIKVKVASFPKFFVKSLEQKKNPKTLKPF